MIKKKYCFGLCPIKNAKGEIYVENGWDDPID